MSQKSKDRPLKGIPLLLGLLLVLPLAVRMMPFAGPTPLRCESPVFIELKGDVAWPGVFAACGPLDVSDRSAMDRNFGWPIKWTGENEAISLMTGATFSADVQAGKALLSPGEMSPFYKATLGIPISVNVAEPDSLTSIPGIGLRLAQRIVRERDRRGGFRRIEELMTVNGIGPSLYKRIKPHLVL